MIDYTLTAPAATTPYTRLAQVWLNRPEGYDEAWGLEEPQGNRPFLVGATWDGQQWHTLGCLDRDGLAIRYPFVPEATALEAVNESVREMLHESHISGDTLELQAVVL